MLYSAWSAWITRTLRSCRRGRPVKRARSAIFIPSLEVMEERIVLSPFNPATNYNVGSSPYSVAAGDFNGDGKLDLVVANFNSNSVSVLLGNGDGTFGAAVNYGAGPPPF